MNDRLQAQLAATPSQWSEKQRRLGWVLDVLLPPQCLRCATIVETHGTLCPPCWSTIRFIERPLCDACGIPFEFDVGEGALCPECIRDRPEYTRSRAALVYDEGSRGMILGLKHGDRTDTVSAFARWMARAGAELLAEADVIVPVPLHWTRLFARRYNQSALIAHALGKLSGVTVVPDLLVRFRRTPPLGKLGAVERRTTIRNVFAVHPRRGHHLEGRRVLLIDDVHTTGSTARGCARTLLSGGAVCVNALTLARSVRDGT